MDRQLMKKLNRQGILFATIHMIVFINLAVDFFVVPYS